MRVVKVFELKLENGTPLKVYAYDALFHGFGVDYEELDGIPGNYSTAIVEKMDGDVKNVPVEMISFDTSYDKYVIRNTEGQYLMSGNTWSVLLENAKEFDRVDLYHLKFKSSCGFETVKFPGESVIDTVWACSDLMDVSFIRCVKDEKKAIEKKDPQD